jgi:basic amino acid/polyamine antiporter, APA family
LKKFGILIVETHGRLSDASNGAVESDGKSTLQRTLGTRQLVFLGVGAIIGAGIFVATGTVAAEHTGPAVVYSFILAAVACLLAGLCYAEFAAFVPEAGSAYTYVTVAFGPGAGWMIGWCLMLEYLMAIANVAVGWSGYVRALLHSFGWTIPPYLCTPSFAVSVSGELVRTGAIFNAPAVFLLVTITYLLTRGATLSVRTNTLLVAVKLVVITLFIVWGAFYVNPANWKPFLPDNTGEIGNYGWSGVLRGAGVVFYAYLGFDTVSTAARETLHPQRSMPIAIIGSLLLCTAIYIGFSLVLTGLAPYRLLAAPNPVSVALEYAGPRLFFLKLSVEIGAIVGLTSVVLVLLFGQSRILYAMSRDGVLPSIFNRINQRTHAPYAAVIGSGSIAILAAGFFPVEVLGELISIGTLCAFVFVCAGVLYLRITRPHLVRPFRTPFAPVVCTSGVIVCCYLMYVLSWATWRRFIAWSAIGMAIYLLYVLPRATRRLLGRT